MRISQSVLQELGNAEFNATETVQSFNKWVDKYPKKPVMNRYGIWISGEHDQWNAPNVDDQELWHERFNRLRWAFNSAGLRQDQWQYVEEYLPGLWGLYCPQLDLGMSVTFAVNGWMSAKYAKEMESRLIHSSPADIFDYAVDFMALGSTLTGISSLEEAIMLMSIGLD